MKPKSLRCVFAAFFSIAWVACATVRPATDGFVVLESHKFMCGAAKGLG